jgi:hypothetical protein
MTTTRRDAAAAGPIPGSPMPRPGRSEARRGHLPAYRRRAVPTREYQCGGQPIHTVPARRPIHKLPDPTRPPPRPTAPITRSRAGTRPVAAPQTNAINQANRHLDRPFHIRTYQGETWILDSPEGV